MVFMNPGSSSLIRVLYFTLIFAFCIKIQMASVIPAADDHTRDHTSINLTESDAITYLRRFGYLPDNKQSSNIITKSTVSQAIAEFQDFAGLDATGVLDKDTINLMSMPRCGLKDKQTFTSDSHQENRVKRFVLEGSRWPKYNLKYKINTYPRKANLRRSIVDKEIARAFAVWSEYTDLTFRSVQNGYVDIDIFFERGAHGDGDPFDGIMGILAHAFYPRHGGSVHFDDDEDWTVDSYSGTNLFQVAAHEIGHALGLKHSKDGSLMAPIYREYDPNFQLPFDDIQGIQAIYGKKTVRSTGSPIPPKNPVVTTSAPAAIPSVNESVTDLCELSKIDAVFYSGANIFFFLGDYYWKMVHLKLVDGYPQLISNTWPGLPGNIDTAFRLADTYTYFFKGSKYWRYSRGHSGEKLDDNYPKEISMGFRGIPNDISAATVMPSTGLIFFFKELDYYTYDWNSATSAIGPIPISATFPLLANGVDAAYATYDRIFLFHNSKYYTYDYNFSEIVGERSMKTNMFGCPRE